jgi:hypothetical protein
MENNFNYPLQGIPEVIERGPVEIIFWVYKGGYKKTASPFLIDLFRLTHFNHESN